MDEPSLTGGRHADDLEAVRRARKLRGGAKGPLLAVYEAEALIGLLRDREALAVSTRALARRPLDRDVAARLRLLRAHALWQTGQVDPARAEVRKAQGEAAAPLTRARVHEMLGFLAWKDQDLEGAGAHLCRAREIYEAQGSHEDEVGVLEKEAAILRDAGRLEESLLVQHRRLETAEAGSRLEAVALGRHDRGALLTAMGRWQEARHELDAAAGLFRQLADLREVTLAGLSRAAVDLATGDLPAARAALEKARAVLEGGRGRRLGESLLLTSDLHLAAGEPERAEQAAAEALRLFTLVKDREGECRSRVRRAHALVALGRAPEAKREARRALKVVAPCRKDLCALALVALGRAVLRTRPREAREAFDRALTQAADRPALQHLARIGRALAAGATRSDEEVGASLRALEKWGDRRILAFCLSDLRQMLGSEPCAGSMVVAECAPVAQADGLPLLVDAAVALGGSGEWPARWAAAMQAIHPFLPWWRTALVAEVGLELRRDMGDPVLLPPADLARDLAFRCGGPAVVDLSESGHRDHPVRVLHGLAAAIVAPVCPGTLLYLDTREGQAFPGGRELGFIVHFARLLAFHLPPSIAPEAPPAFPGILGRCPAMESLCRDMARVAPSDVSVHISGETGTGKEKVAKALHLASPRRGRGFVAINASSLSDELFEAEMFGHARGAFTGAVAARDGHVVEAEGGTLFIDEVTDLSPRAQAKLLRLIQEREFRRLGETHLRRADIRILSAANASLEQRVAAGAFRKDLMYRLNVVVLNLPPLRDRGEDVLVLARHSLGLAAARAGIPAPPLPADVARAIARYSWPGNIRELENEMNRLVVLAGKGPLRKDHLSFREAGQAPAATSFLRDARLSFERDYVAAALTRNKGNRVRTACDLGVTRQALLLKMRRLGISCP